MHRLKELATVTLILFGVYACSALPQGVEAAMANGATVALWWLVVLIITGAVAFALRRH